MSLAAILLVGKKAYELFRIEPDIHHMALMALMMVKLSSIQLGRIRAQSRSLPEY